MTPAGIWMCRIVSFALGCALILCLNGCGSAGQFSVCGAPVSNCPDLDPQAAEVAFAAVGKAMYEANMLASPNICQFGGELEIECKANLGSENVGLYWPWPFLKIEIISRADACGAAQILNHEIIHWASDRLLGIDSGDHKMPFYTEGPFALGCGPDLSIEACSLLYLMEKIHCYGF